MDERTEGRHWTLEPEMRAGELEFNTKAVSNYEWV